MVIFVQVKIYFTRGDGEKYRMTYNEFHKLASVGLVDGDGNLTPLTSYTYANGNGKLKTAAYANGHSVTYSYNNYGQLIAETWRNPSGTIEKRYKFSYENQNNLAKVLDISEKRLYNYVYEDGILIKATESAVEVDENEYVTSKVLLRTVRYAGVRFKYRAVFRTDSDSFLILMFLDNRTLDLWFELKQTNLSSDKFKKSENFSDISDVKSIDPDGKFPLEPDAFSSSVHLTNDGYLIYVFYDYNEAENDLIIKDIGKLRI